MSCLPSLLLYSLLLVAHNCISLKSQRVYTCALYALSNTAAHYYYRVSSEGGKCVQTVCAIILFVASFTMEWFARRVCVPVWLEELYRRVRASCLSIIIYTLSLSFAILRARGQDGYVPY